MEEIKSLKEFKDIQLNDVETIFSEKRNIALNCRSAVIELKETEFLGISIALFKNVLTYCCKFKHIEKTRVRVREKNRIVYKKVNKVVSWVKLGPDCRKLAIWQDMELAKIGLNPVYLIPKKNC